MTLKDGSVFLGQVASEEPIPAPGTPEHNKRHRLQLKVGNRDLLGFDFKWIDEDTIAVAARSPPTPPTSSGANTGPSWARRCA